MGCACMARKTRGRNSAALLAAASWEWLTVAWKTRAIPDWMQESGNTGYFSGNYSIAVQNSLNKRWTTSLHAVSYHPSQSTMISISRSFWSRWSPWQSVHKEIQDKHCDTMWANIWSSNNSSLHTVLLWYLYGIIYTCTQNTQSSLPLQISTPSDLSTCFSASIPT